MPMIDPASAEASLFHRVGLRTRIGLCQLPLTAILVCIVLAAPAAWPGMLDEPLFQASLLVHVLLLMCCWAFPWERLPHHASLLIPLGDMGALTLSHIGAAEFLSGFPILLIFPVIWLSASNSFPRFSALISFLGPLLIIAPPLLGRSTPPTAAEATGAVLVPVMLLAVSLGVRFVTANMALQQRRLEKKDADLRQLLEVSSERESLLQTILDTIDIGVITVDQAGKTMLTNHQHELFQRSTGSQGDADSERHTLALFGQDRKTPLPESRWPVTRAAAGETFGDYLVWVGEGSTARALSTAARTIETESGNFRGAVLAYNDVTSLVEALRAKDEVIATVSHELRTPITSIVGNLEFAANANSPEDASRYVEIAYKNAERLSELVSSLLQSGSAGMKVYPRETDFAGLIDSVVGSVLPQAAAAGIDIRTDVPAPLWTHTDPLRMAQVLDNLLSNAIKYSPEGGVVAIRARADDGLLTLDVQDTGIGLSPPDAARVFERFFRAKSARVSAIPGTGLGLAITKAIVEGHSGTISCASKPGYGSTFTISLPARA
ncbi:signal transduction histidine kinase [Arthrobacter sp. CAN_A6]